MKKKAALELSIGTIVVIVIAVTLLSLGMVFVRKIMCSAIGLTGDINDKVTAEIDRLFGSTGGEVQCIGSAGEPIKMEPGKMNIVYCGIKAKREAKYSIILEDWGGTGLTKSELRRWIIQDEWSGTVAPGDETPKKIIRVSIPDDAPEENIWFTIKIKREGSTISTQTLDFKISRSGLLQRAMC